VGVRAAGALRLHSSRRGGGGVCGGCIEVRRVFLLGLSCGNGVGCEGWCRISASFGSWPGARSWRSWCSCSLTASSSGFGSSSVLYRASWVLVFCCVLRRRGVAGCHGGLRPARARGPLGWDGAGVVCFGLRWLGSGQESVWGGGGRGLSLSTVRQHSDRGSPARVRGVCSAGPDLVGVRSREGVVQRRGVRG